MKTRLTNHRAESALLIKQAKNPAWAVEHLMVKAVEAFDPERLASFAELLDGDEIVTVTVSLEAV